MVQPQHMLMLLLSALSFTGAAIAQGTPSSSTNANYTIAHGALMCAVWALLIPFGILVARHRWLVELDSLKWAAKSRLAFIIGAMCLATAGMIAAFIIPYQTFTKGQNMSKAPEIMHAHSVIGVLLMSWVGFHAILGGLRPRGEKPDPRLMNLWNWVHSVTGYVTAGLAISNMYIGIYIYSRRRSSSVQAAWYAPVTVTLALALALGVTLELGKRRWDAKAKQLDLASDVEAKATPELETKAAA